MTVEFIGVFDTVEAVGTMLPRTLPFPGTNHMVKTFRHAMSLDEHRAAYQAQPWQRTLAGKDRLDVLRTRGRKRIGLFRSLGGVLGDKVKTGTSLTMEVGESDSTLVIPPGKGTDCKEVYFVGCHSGEYLLPASDTHDPAVVTTKQLKLDLLLDVGGGSVPNHTRWSLANIPLRWMIKEILEAQPGIIFRDDPRLADMGIYLNPLAGAQIQGEDRRARAYTADASGPEGVTAVVGPDPPESDDSPSSYMPIDARPQDVIARINDKLKNPLWWVLEFYPFVTGYQDEQDVWHNRIRYVTLLHSPPIHHGGLYYISSPHPLGTVSH